ncbi:diaminopimelate epimerase [Dethiosulfovibrio sp. F2B]|uniref:diaminopimelate epimerase n=1 Tax=Dethiosulfovibrio faecalis TaxID=2720018 RepID=UPI001F1A8BF0|nr:diaminopimelate epimerase [Dethiosulfovibrio faecalis]
MIPLNFWKMNGNGNDFVVIDRDGMAYGQLVDLTRRVCRRRRSIGADGVLVVEPSDNSDFRMRVFNSDGSEGEMCGNGARCIARYAFERGVAPFEMSFETIAGIMKARVEGSFVNLDMGEVDLGKGWFGRKVPMAGGEVEADFLIVGVPHLVIYLEDPEKVDREDLIRWGRTLREDRRLFPEGTNVNFVGPVDRRSLKVWTYERGVEDLTDSCGTGSCASAVAAVRRLDLESPVTVCNPGGVNIVTATFREDLCDIVLGGETAVVAKGTIEEEA